MPKHERTYWHRPDGGISEVDLKIAEHALWLVGDENNGLQPGSFVTRLWWLIAGADQANVELIRSIYPGYVEAFEAAMRTTWGLEWLRNKVMDARVMADV